MVRSIEDVRRRTGERMRVPPHNLEAEESLLGAMLLSRDAIAAAVEVCGADDFYKPSHAHIFGAIQSLFGQGEPADPITVCDELARAGLLEAVGGPAALVSLQAHTPATTRAEAYARIVEEHALLRRLIGVSSEIAELGYSLPDDIEAAVDQAETMVFQVAHRRVADTIRPLRDLLEESLDRLSALYERNDSVIGVPTGYTDLDEQLSGLQPSNLVIVGARPGAGKTSFALGVAAHASMNANVPVVFFSLEMDRSEITQRLLSAEARIESTRMRNGRLHESDWTKISHAIGRLSGAPLFIDDNPAITVMDIRAKARRLKAKHGGLGLVIVDYLQLMTGRTKAETRQVEVAEISRGLKILARELQIPVLALSQLSRQLELRADKRPMLADLRESGCLTGDARVLRADTGAEVTMGELFVSGERDIPVWSLDEDLKMVASTMTHVFSTGMKEVFELRLASGRAVTASANHPFLTIDGWARLDELTVGSRIAVPRAVSEPTRGSRMLEAEIVMLAHLIGDGCVASRQPVHYTNADIANVEAVERAAATFGITPRRVRQKNWWHVYLPSPYPLTHGKRNPIQRWLEPMGLDGLRSYEKFVPARVFGLATPDLALFLRHLWATDGSLRLDRKVGQVRLYYSTSSRRLADDLVALLSRFEIVARTKVARKAGYRDNYHVLIYGAAEQLRFLREIGVHGARGEVGEEAVAYLEALRTNTNLDTVPREVWSRVRERIGVRGFTTRSFQSSLGGVYNGSGFYRHAPSRARLGRIATLLDDPGLERLARSEVFWDRVVAIESRGEQPVYDATVEGTHNFVANGVVVENSLEQDSDVVMFIHRPEQYDSETADRGVAEVIVAKHRNGPTGHIKLAFLEQWTRFANMARV